MSGIEVVEEGSIESLLEISVDEIKEVEQDQLGPQHKLQAIDQILADKHDAIETSDEKHAAIEAAIAGQLAPHETKQSFSNPEENLEQIKTVLKDDTLSHPHQKFASIEAILGDHANSNNPWVQAHKSLKLIGESSRSVIKAEEKREKERRKTWKAEMDKKAEQYPDQARGQEFWQKIGILPMVAGQIASAKFGQEIGAQISKAGSEFTQAGAQINKLYKQDMEIHYTHTAAQAEQDNSQQGQSVTEARQNDTALKERHLEILKTLTNQLINH